MSRLLGTPRTPNTRLVAHLIGELDDYYPEDDDWSTSTVKNLIRIRDTYLNAHFPLKTTAKYMYDALNKNRVHEDVRITQFARANREHAPHKFMVLDIKPEHLTPEEEWNLPAIRSATEHIKPYQIKMRLGGTIIEVLTMTWGPSPNPEVKVHKVVNKEP